MRWQQARDPILLVTILALGLGFRIWRCGAENLVFDEIWHIELSTGRGSVHEALPKDAWIASAGPMTTLDGAPPWYAVWTNITGAVHPPLYFLLLRIWREVFGSAENTMRALSIVCSMATIALIFQAGKKTLGLAPAAWGAMIFAVAPPQFWLAQQVRGYALLFLLCMAALLLLIRLENAPRERWLDSIWLGLAVLGMMLTHYFALGGAIAIGLYVLIRLRGKKRAYAIASLIAAAVVYSIIWLPLTFRQTAYAAAAGEWLITGEPWHALQTFRRFFTRPWYLTVADESNGPWQFIFVPLFLVVPFLFRKNRGLLLWYLWLICTLGLLAVLDLLHGSTHLNYVRYAAIAAPACYLLIPALASQLSRTPGHVLPAIVVCCAIGTSRTVFIPEEPGYPEVGRLLDERAARDESVVFHRGSLPHWHTQSLLHLAVDHYSHTFPRPVLRLTQPAMADLVHQSPGPTAWLVSGRLSKGVEELLPGAKVIEEQEIEKWLWVRRVQLSGSDSAHPATRAATPASAPQ